MSYLKIKVVCVQESKCNYSAHQKSEKKEGFEIETKQHEHGCITLFVAPLFSISIL